MKNEHVSAVILAGGSGSRMNLATPKQYVTVAGESVLRRCVRAFEECGDVDSIVVVVKDGDEEIVKGELKNDFSKLHAVVFGGFCRAVSAKNGFEAIPKEAHIVAIHDAARCLISPMDISRVIDAAKKYGAASAASPITNTVKLVDEMGVIKATVPRSELMAAETPQVFRAEIYRKALREFCGELESVTDDNSLVEAIGESIHCVTVEGNIKITTKRDLDIAEFLLSKERSDE